MQISVATPLQAAVLGLVLSGLAPALAKADPLVPTVIVDAATGEVLQSEEATRPWYPASTTKLMTAYVALRAIKLGQIKFDTPLVASGVAAHQPPSKIGIRPGQEITLENALKILMVKSANDVATVVAEGVGGSVEGFAGMMNREAARLGMRESHFVNPHGLHRDNHVTSVRDMAILARALLVEFPEYSELWSIGAVQLGTRKYSNTNGLIGRYPGALGMKTGFVCASGFNLVSAAERGGRTLIAVVFGAASAADRTLKAAQLLDQGFSGGGFGLFGGGGGGGRKLEQLTASIETSAPNRRAEICGRRGPPASEEDSGAAIAYSGGSVNTTSDREPSIVFPAGGIGQASAVGQRFGNKVALGPREPTEPIPVYLGPKPGSTEIARRAGGIPEPAVQAASLPATSQAFAALPGRKANAHPLALDGTGSRAGAASRIGNADAAPSRPAAAASLASRGLPPVKLAAPARSLTAAKAPEKLTAGKKKAAAKGKTTPAKVQPVQAQLDRKAARKTEPAE